MFRSGIPESPRWAGTSSVRMFRANGSGLFDDMVDDAVFALAQWVPSSVFSFLPLID